MHKKGFIVIQKYVPLVNRVYPLFLRKPIDLQPYLLHVRPSLNNEGYDTDPALHFYP